MNRPFALGFNANDSRIGHSRYLLPIPIIDDYNTMLYGRNVFDQQVKNYIKTYENIEKLQLVNEMVTQVVVF